MIELLDKECFPTLVNNPDLAYFDNCATTQTHRCVIQAMNEYYEHYRANVGRSDYHIADRAAEAVDKARSSVAKIIPDASPDQLLFTTGATQALNWIAEWNKDVPQVILAISNHNANIAPWLAQGRTQDNGRLAVLHNSSRGEIERVLSNAPKGSLLSISVVDNVLCEMFYGIRSLIGLAHDHGIQVCLDMSQTVIHSFIKILAPNGRPDKYQTPGLPVEWAVFSGHKMFGPTGVGVLYTSWDMDRLRPIYYGGSAAYNVTFNGMELASGIKKHTPGTQNIANIIGMGEAAELINYITLSKIRSSHSVLYHRYVAAGIITEHGKFPSQSKIPGLQLLQQCPSDVLTFASEIYDVDLIGAMLAEENIAVRTGNLCAHPYVNHLSKGRGVLRISGAAHNTKEDVEKLADSLRNIVNTLG